MNQKTSPISAETQPDLLSEEQLWGAPKRGDGEFLVAVRSRLNNQPKGMWLAVPKFAAVSAFTLLLVVGVWMPGQLIDNTQVITESVDLNTAVEFLAETEITPQDVAVYLGVPEAIEDTVYEAEYAVDEPSTDELLNLDDTEFELVMNDLEQTTFF